MKKLAPFICSASLLAVSAHASSLLSGWDFSNYSFDDTSWTEQSGIGVDTNQIVSLYSDLTADGAASSNGTLTYQGGAANTTFGQSSGNLSSGLAISSRPLGPNFGTSPNGSSGSQFGMQLNNAGQLLFVTDTAGLSFDFTDAGSIVQYAATVSGGTNASISWEVSINGVDFFSTGDTHTVTNTLGSGGSLFTVDLDELGSNYSGDVYLRASVAGVVTGSELFMDNVQVLGTAVPEPSTYAFLAGVCVLGLVVYNRRRRTA